MPPVEPPPSRWRLPDPTDADEHGLAGIGADLEPGTLLAAYRSGLFPMPLRPAGPMGWWSPDPRGILGPERLRVSRSLRRSCRRYEIRVDTAFEQVVAACADPARPRGWITPAIVEAYTRLHRLGWAHSVEAWDDDGLAGGLYGVAIGGLFAGESMFRWRTDASKVALVGLVDVLTEDGTPGRIIDVQWRTDHLAGLGAVEVRRLHYLAMLKLTLKLPLPPAFA